MGTYIARRLLLMIPTLIGITFLVFMLVALSPGGVGAALDFAGGAMEASSAAQQRAYLEERYGLDDPVIVQYLRWLRQISPVKFGQRDLVSPSGAMMRPPRSIRPPPLVDWWGGSVGPDVPLPPPPTFENQAELQRHFIVTSNRAMQQRIGYIVANAELRVALENYARAVNLPNATDRKGDIRLSAFRRTTPDRTVPEWAAIEVAGARSLAAMQTAREGRAALIVAYSLRPFPQAGVPIIPGVISLGAPDFGTSHARGRTVSSLIVEALPVTILLNLIAFPIIYLVAIPSGMLAAARRGTWMDISLGATFVALWSIPTVWAGVLALGYLSNPQYLGWFPVSGLSHRTAGEMTFLPTFTDGFSRGFMLDTLWHLCLPVACLVYTGFAVLSKQTRAAMLDNFSADYVRTARAKGVPNRAVILRHVFRNSLLPLITMFVGLFPAMLSGSVVIETIFTVPGMGRLAIEAIALRDRELILANTVMIAVVNLLALLLADILYALADPRVSYD